MLQQHRLLPRELQLLREPRRRLRAHHRMAQQLPLEGVIGRKAQRGKSELLRLRHVVQQRPAEKQVAVDDLGVLPGEEIRRAQHAQRVHQQAAHKAVVHGLGRRDAGEGLPLFCEHGLGRAAVVRVPHGGDQRLDLSHGVAPVDGRGGHQLVEIVAVVPVRRADAPRRKLAAALEFRDLAAHLDDRPGAVRRELAGVVPDHQIDRTGAIRERAGEIGLARAGRAQGGRGEDVEALDLVAELHVGDRNIVLHVHSPFCRYRAAMSSSRSSSAESPKPSAARISPRSSFCVRAMTAWQTLS